MSNIYNNGDMLNADCALPHALSLMGEKWSFMILRAAFDDIRHFEGFLNTIGLARNILANRLARLTEGGILVRTPCPNDRRKVEYRLTQKGLDLLPVMIGLRQWGEKWATGIASTPILVDQNDKKPIKEITIRSHDDRILTWEDLCWMDSAAVTADSIDMPIETKPINRNIIDNESMNRDTITRHLQK